MAPVSLPLSNPVKVFLALLVVAMIAAPSARADSLALELENHDHDGIPHFHPESSLERKLQEAVAQETGYEIDGHEASEGPNLSADNTEHSLSLYNPQLCPTGASTKQYTVSAIAVTMVLNRWGDRDPEAFVYALDSQIDAIRAQEAKVDSEADHYGLRLGLGSDPLQPLTMRANVGDCISVTFTNRLDHPSSFHVHGSDFVLSVSGEPALSTNPASIAAPGQTVEYQWYVDPNYYGENTHYVHTHGPNARYLVGHGLFGAILVEPKGTEYFDQRTGQPSDPFAEFVPGPLPVEIIGGQFRPTDLNSPINRRANPHVPVSLLFHAH